MDSYLRHDDTPLGMRSSKETSHPWQTTQRHRASSGGSGSGGGERDQPQPQSRVVGSYLLKFAEKNHFGRNYAKFLESTYSNANANANANNKDDASDADANADGAAADNGAVIQEEKAGTPPGSTAEDHHHHRINDNPPHAAAEPSLTPSRTPSQPPLVVYDDDEMNSEYASQLATLTRVFSSSDPSWTERHLSAVLRSTGGNLTDSITTVVEHGDGDPDDLVRELQEREVRAQAAKRKQKEKEMVAAVVSPKPSTLRCGVPTEFTVPTGGMAEDDVSVLSSGLTVAMEERYHSTSRHRTMGRANLEVTETKVTGSPESKITPQNTNGAAARRGDSGVLESRGRLSVIRDDDYEAEDGSDKEAKEMAQSASKKGEDVKGCVEDERSAPAGRDPPTHASEMNGEEEDDAAERTEGEGGSLGDDDTIGNLEKKVLQLVGKLGGEGDSLSQSQSLKSSSHRSSSGAEAAVATTAGAAVASPSSSKQTKEKKPAKEKSSSATSKPPSAASPVDEECSRQEQQWRPFQAEEQQTFQAEQEQRYLEQIAEQQTQIRHQTRQLQLNKERLSHQAVKIEQLEEENGALRSNRRSRERELERENEVLRRKLSKLAGKVESLSATLERVLSAPPPPPATSTPSTTCTSTSTPRSQPPATVREEDEYEDDEEDEEDDSIVERDDCRRRNHHRSSSRAYI